MPRYRVSSARLFYALLVGLVLAALQDPAGWTGVAFRFYMIGVLMEALVSVSGRGRQLRIAAVLATVCLVSNVYVTATADTRPLPLALFCLLVFAFQVAGVHIHKVMFSRRVTGETIYSAMTAYLVVALGFTASYLLVAMQFPHSFVGQLHAHRLFPNASPGDMIYFSIATLTTAGFGDISPVEPIGRMVANVEMLFGTLYPTVILARLVGLHGATLTAENDLPDL